jgi:signal transduction histidine kinase
VEDTGTGIPPEILGRAFEPFSTTKEVGKASGLGLSTAHGFIAQSTGHVGITTSKPGRGTCISVVLPAADRQSAGRAASDADGTRG